MWTERIGQAQYPELKAEKFDQYEHLLKHRRQVLDPIDYFEKQMDLAACRGDHINETETFKVALTEVRNDGELRAVYHSGANSGKPDERYDTSSTDPVTETLYRRIGKLLVQEVGRRRVDIHAGLDTLDDPLRRSRLDRLFAIDRSALLIGMKAIASAKLFQIYTGEAIKSLAENRRQYIPKSKAPRATFEYIYRGTPNPGSKQKGFAEYAGFYETFSSEISDMFSKEFTGNAAQAEAIVHAVLDISPQIKSPGSGMRDIHHRQLSVLSLVSLHRLDEAENSLRAFYYDERLLFNPNSVKAVFGKRIKS